MQILVILLGISGILAAGCFGAFGHFFNVMGGWVIGVPMLLIGGAIGYFSIWQLFRKFLMSSSAESPTPTFSEEAQAILVNAATRDVEARHVAGKMFEHGEHGATANRDTTLQRYRLAIGGLLAAGYFGYFGIMFIAKGGLIIGAPLLLIGGTIGFFSIRQMFGTSPTSSFTESAMTESSDAAHAILAKADAGDAEALFQCGAHFEKGSGGFAFDRALAKDCYRRAAALGQADALKRLKLLEEDPLDILNQPRRRLRRS